MRFYNYFLGNKLVKVTCDMQVHFAISNMFKLTHLPSNDLTTFNFKLE